MKDIGVYIHIPFCKAKCLYCDFISFGGKETLYEQYKNALIDEIASADFLKERNIKTIFIGGGTPTIMPPEFISEILEAVYQYNVDKNAEITIEANPKTINKEMLKVLKYSGVNRLSIGLQSTDNYLLKRLGRIHSYEDFLVNYNDAVQTGFKNINIDLMFGVPEQTVAILNETIGKIVLLKPQHISVYSLIVEENTKFYQMQEENMLVLPHEDDERLMYRNARDYLNAKGYLQYEISNFALKGYESQHNTVYWKMGEYIGFGVSAHSFYEGTRFSNTSDIDVYIQKTADDDIRDTLQVLSRQEEMEEFMFLGLRMIEGISVNDFKRRFDADIFSIYKAPIAAHKKSGLLIEKDGRLFLSPRGIEFSNRVMADFLF